MDAAPPKLPAGQRTSGMAWWLKFFLGLAALAALVVVFVFEPSSLTILPQCQFRRLTGLNCPGCGMTRGLHALLHGDFATALRDNALLIAGLVFAAARGLWFLVKKPAAEFFPMRWLWILIAIAILFTVLRNLPAFAFLSPR